MTAPDVNIAGPRFRVAAQDRSAHRQRKIVAATLRTIADHGLANTTHRLIAENAGASAAAISYYYGSKNDLIAHAARAMAQENVAQFDSFAQRSSSIPGFTVRDFVTRIAANAGGKHKRAVLGWCEIVLAGARGGDMREVTRDLFISLVPIWRRAAGLMQAAHPNNVAISGLDTVIGLFFLAKGLDLSDAQVAAVLGRGEDIERAWGPGETPDQLQQNDSRGAKAKRTRQRILEAAAEILLAEGESGVTYRAVAQKAGLTTAAPTYHFPTTDALLVGAQQYLFDITTDRRRNAPAGLATLTRENFAERVAEAFMDEAIANARVQAASYPVWLRASREARLRPVVWRVIRYQHDGWRTRLEQLMGGVRPLEALTLQALWIGKSIRIMAMGNTPEDLASAEAEFRFDVDAVLAQRHWLIMG